MKLEYWILWILIGISIWGIVVMVVATGYPLFQKHPQNQGRD